MSGLVIRVQDRFGRGPYRPGMPARWSDPAGPLCPPWWKEIGETLEAAHARMDGGLHYGCGFRSREQMGQWFTAREEKALDRLGYKLVALAPDWIIAETERQLVFGCKAPLTMVWRSCRLGSLAAERLAA